MRFYTQSHTHYCGVDLHARSIYLCILSHDGEILLHRNAKATPTAFLRAIKPYRNDLVVAVECMFTWYWLADLCGDEGIHFVLGHALYMRAIHGGKAKNDRIDAQKIAMLLRGGMFPMAYVYPRAMRATRDLLRRRMHLMRKRSELLAHIHNTNSQYNLPEIRLNLRYQRNRAGIAERFDDPSVARSMELDLTLIDVYDRELKQVEWFILKHARKSDQHGLVLLRTVPGIGEILSLVMLYEIHSIDRFETVQRFASYCRLIKCRREAAVLFLATIPRRRPGSSK